MNITDPRYLFVSFKDGDGVFFLGRFLSSHFELAQYHAVARPWYWDELGATEGCLDDAWAMLAAWRALRGVKVAPVEFRERCPAQVVSLARFLNKHGIGCLRDLAGADDRTLGSLIQEVVLTVEQISLIKPTKDTRPTFGSKVAHHYFPSIVPAFDNAKIEEGALRKSWICASFCDQRREWVRRTCALENEPFLLDFALYFAFCADQIATAPQDKLDAARSRLAQSCKEFVPPGMWSDRGSLVWKLDAKVAEFCLCGHAKLAAS